MSKLDKFSASELKFEDLDEVSGGWFWCWTPPVICKPVKPACPPPKPKCPPPPPPCHKRWC